MHNLGISPRPGYDYLKFMMASSRKFNLLAIKKVYKFLRVNAFQQSSIKPPQNSIPPVQVSTLRRQPIVVAQAAAPNKVPTSSSAVAVVDAAAAVDAVGARKN